MNDDALEDLLSAYAELLDTASAAAPESPEAFVARQGVRDPRALPALRRLAETTRLFEDAIETPRRVGPYRVSDVLGRGGVGVVFRAVRDDRPEEIVALKVLALPSAISARAVERFRRESAALARIDHPGVVRIRDAGETPEGAYVAMDLIHGVSLADHGPIVATQAAELISALARAVAAAHEAGVVHRDIKPSNVVLKADGSPVLLDFGLAVADDATSLTGTGDVLGTPRYMAPEQAAGRETGPPADIYALGAVLHELLAGRPPHGDVPPSALIDVLRREPAPSLVTTLPAAPPLLIAVVDRALAFAPADRYDSASAFADDLDAWLAGRPTSARPPTTVERLGRALRRRRRMLLGAAVVAGAVVLGVLLAPSFSDGVPSTERFARAVVAAEEAWIDDEPARAKTAALAALAADRGSAWAALLSAIADDVATATASDPIGRAFLEGERRRKRDPDGAFAHFQWAASERPDDGLLLHRLGIVAGLTDRPDLAVRTLDRAARILPGSRRAAADLASALAKRKEFAEAARKLSDAVARSPDDGDLWYRLAKAQLQAGELDQALRSASTALGRLGEDGLKAYVLYGVALDANGRHADARAAYDVVLLRRPKHANALFNKGVSFDGEHRVQEAEASYLAAVDADPRSARYAIALAHLYAGASRDVCEGCRLAYERSPKCLDFGKARTFAWKALRASKGTDAAVVDFVVTTALKIGARDEALQEIEALRTGREAESAPSTRADASRRAAIANLSAAATTLRNAPASRR